LILVLITLLAILLTAIFIGTPVAFALGFTTVASTLLYLSPNQLAQIGTMAFNQGTSMNQLVAPLFILMAEFLARGNVAADIFMVLNKYLQRVKGGLALSATLASTVFAALCGSSPATAAAIGRISIKQMIHRGYREDFAVGTVVAGGTLGIMIPPSITFVTYGIITENSIAKLLIAGILPGLLISFLLCLFIVIRVKLNPALQEGSSRQVDEETASFVQEQAGGIGQDLKLLIPSFVLIFVVIGSLYSGIATPTEAAGFGAIGAMLLVLYLRRLTKELFISTLPAAARTSTMILFLVICGLSLSYVISYLGLAQSIAKIIVASGLNKWLVMTMLYILWFMLGCLMDPGSMVILTIPFVYPTIIALGFDPIWLGVVSTLCVEIGMITPPVGLNLFVIRTVTDVPMNKIITGTLPYVLVLITALIIITIFPEIALYLPSRM
jgi:tripartite ATP-independent transporter DctM subunit